MKRFIGAVIVIAALLAGCSGTATPTADTPPPAVSTPTPTPTPTPTFRPVSQFASVVAGVDPDFRDASKAAGDCRLLYVTAETPIEQVKQITCYLNETSVDLNASSATRDIKKLGNPPPEISDLVDETLTAFKALVDADMYGKCGTDGKETKKCDEATGAQYAAYIPMIKVLNKWKPYM